MRPLRGSIGGEHWQYRELLRSTIVFARVVIKPKDNVHLRVIMIKIDDMMFHISRELLKQLSFNELEVIQRKVKYVNQEDDFLQNLLTTDMDAALPEVYMKPKMADLFTLSITKPNLVYHKGFAFSIDSY